MYLVVALTHAIYPKLTPLLRARRKTESHAIAKTHTTNSKSHCAQLIQHSMENLREEGIRTRCWTRSERDGNEIQALHLATFPFFLPQPQIIGKNTMFHDFPKISRTRICFLLTLSLLCFSSVHIVGRLTPTLPLNISYIFQSLPHSDWWQHLQPSPNTAGTQTLSTSCNIQKITKSTKTWQKPCGHAEWHEFW